MASPAASAAPAGASSLPAWGRHPEHLSGPLVARLFQQVFGVVLLCAWVSLASQIRVLIGSRGLLPAAEHFAAARAAGLGFAELPSLLWFWHSDAALVALGALGCALAVLIVAGVRPRLCLLLTGPLYLSFAAACSDFTAFQWDNLLVEASLLAALVPTDRRAALAHFAMRVLLFKLYFESGIAKWQSHLGDWHDGSAMTFYYETAPLPAALAYHAHHLPAALHRLESWGALLLELVVPLLIFGPRPARLCAFAAFTGFQILNTATANYGFFTYMSVSLHLFLLGDGDVARLRDRLRARLPAWAFALRAERAGAAAVPERAQRYLAAVAIGLWLIASLLTAAVAFARDPRPPRALRELVSTYAPFRVANAYHLFGHITRERIEPQFQTLEDGRFREHDLRYKPGDPGRRPPYVAPHQPRVDFRLWFYGLSFRRGMPRYVHNLLDRLCHEPAAVAALFDGPLPDAPDAVRIVFYRYRMSDPELHARTGEYWTREPLHALPARECR